MTNQRSNVISSIRPRLKVTDVCCKGRTSLEGWERGRRHQTLVEGHRRMLQGSYQPGGMGEGKKASDLGWRSQMYVARVLSAWRDGREEQGIRPHLKVTDVCCKGRISLEGWERGTRYPTNPLRPPPLKKLFNYCSALYKAIRLFDFS